jgi:hypothetical protein
MYGYYAATMSSGTNNFAFATNQTAGDNNYAFYSSGTAESYFAGNVGIGTPTPSVSLDIHKVANYPQIALKSYSNDNTYYPTLTFIKSRGTTLGSNVATNSGDYLGFFIWRGMNSSNTVANAAYMIVSQDGAGGATYIPGRFSFWAGTASAGPAEVMRIDSAGNVGIGVTAFGTSATTVLGITADGTVPSSSPAGMIQIYADDSSAGATNATLALRTEQEVEDIGTFTASHKLRVWINGTEYYINLDAV